MPIDPNAWGAILRDPLALQWARFSMPTWARNRGMNPRQFVNRFLTKNPDSIAGRQYRNYFTQNADPDLLSSLQFAGFNQTDPVNPFDAGDARHARWNPPNPNKPIDEGGQVPKNQPIDPTGLPIDEGGQVPKKGPSGSMNMNTNPNANPVGKFNGAVGGPPPPPPGVPPMVPPAGGNPNQVMPNTAGTPAMEMNPWAPELGPGGYMPGLNPGVTDVFDPHQANLSPWAQGMLDWFTQVYGSGGEQQNVIRDLLLQYVGNPTTGFWRGGGRPNRGRIAPQRM